MATDGIFPCVGGMGPIRRGTTDGFENFPRAVPTGIWLPRAALVLFLLVWSPLFLLEAAQTALVRRI